MGALLQRLFEVSLGAANGRPKVALDTCCVQYYINNPPVQPWADCLDPIFRAGIEGKVDLYVSTVVVAELIAHVHFVSRHKAGFDPELDLLAILNRHFQMLDVNGDAARAAGRLRGNYVPGDRIVLKTPDALIGATSLANGHTLFVTNDAELAKALPQSNCIYLRAVALEHLAERFSKDCLDIGTLVTPSRRGGGLGQRITLASPQLGSLKPDPTATRQRLLADAFTVASVLAEPCVFIVLTEKQGRRTAATEILFWHEGLNTTRPASALLRRVEEHLSYSRRSGRAENADSHAWVFCFTSLERERARQADPGFASKSEHQRLADELDGYLKPLWRFRQGLLLPQTTWLLCEDGVARHLKPVETMAFLDQAKSVLGWEEGR